MWTGLSLVIWGIVFRPNMTLAVDRALNIKNQSLVLLSTRMYEESLTCTICADHNFLFVITLSLLLTRSLSQKRSVCVCVWGEGGRDQNQTVIQPLFQQRKGSNSAQQTRDTTTKAWIAYVNSTWHVRKYRVHKLHQWYTLKLLLRWLQKVSTFFQQKPKSIMK